MDKANKVSSAVCYIAGVLGVTRTQEISDILGIILTSLSIASMLVCLIINLINRIKKASGDGKITDNELKEIRDEIHKTEGHINDELKRNDSGTDEDSDGKIGD